MLPEPSFSSEAARVAARCGSDTLRLEPEWPTVLQWMRHMGHVVATTRNRHASVSQSGRFGRVGLVGDRRAFLGGDFAIALRLDGWQTIFATIGESGRRRLRIFDAAGDPVQTLEVGDPAGRAPFDEMVWRLHARDQSTCEPARGPRASLEALRESALHRRGAERAWQIPVDAVRAALERWSEGGRGLSCALGNAGATHAHASNLSAFGGVARWTASFASRATLSIDASAIARAWIVAGGPLAMRPAIELFDAAGERMVCLARYAGT